LDFVLKINFQDVILNYKTTEQKQHSTVRCDEGAEGHGTVVFAIITTVPCSGPKVLKNSKSLAGTMECRNSALFKIVYTLLLKSPGPTRLVRVEKTKNQSEYFESKTTFQSLKLTKKMEVLE